MDLVQSSHYSVAEMEPREVYHLFKVTCIINFRALVLTAEIGPPGRQTDVRYYDPMITASHVRRADSKGDNVRSESL